MYCVSACGRTPIAMKSVFYPYLLLLLCCVFLACQKEQNPTLKEGSSPPPIGVVSPVTADTDPTTVVSETTAVISETTTEPSNEPSSTTTPSSHTGGNAFAFDEPIILAYFPSWSESYVTAGQASKLRNIPAFINHIFLAFAKPDLRYTKGSYDLSETGIEVPYDGCTLKESVGALKAKGINVILSIGGETYWRNASSYEIEYDQIKDLVDDIGFVGIDWDFEPDGSFQQIGNELNVNRFITFFTESRSIMPKEEGYLLACAPAGVGALGGQFNDDPSSPFRYEQRTLLTGENDDLLYQGAQSSNGINLFGFGSTGHMIPVMKAVGDKIDLIAYQGYNTGGSTNRAIMYDAYAYYAAQYGFNVAAGVHYPPEPWGPFYTDTHETIADLSAHIYSHPDRNGRNDGIMIWQLLLEGSESSGFSYLNVAYKALEGAAIASAVRDANTVSLEPYNGGAAGCEGEDGGRTYCMIVVYNPTYQYPNPGTQVVHNCQIWQNKWWINPNEIPGQNEGWEKVGDCTEGEECRD